MAQKELIAQFYEEAAEVLNTEVTAETTFAELNMSSGKYYALISIMEDLGAEDITYKMLKKCETLADAAQVMLDNLDE